MRLPGRTIGFAASFLRGEKPGDLPIQQPLKFEFTVNLKTANELGLKLPESILLRARTIE